MAKKKPEKSPRIVTKRQLSRWQQQQKRQRLILGVGIFIIVAALAIVVTGWYLGQFQPLRQPVIRVNDTEFRMKYYVEMLRLHGGNQSATYSLSLADNVLRGIEQNELIRQGGAKLGVNVSDEAVTEQIKTADLPDEDVYRDLVRNQLLVGKLLDDYFDQQVPVSAEQRHIMGMLLESKPQATEVRTRLESGANFTEIAAELSLDSLARINQGDFGWHPREVWNEVLDEFLVEYAFTAKAGVLSPPLYDEEISKGVGYWLVRVLDRNEDEEEAHVQVMLLGSQAEAQEVRNRLEAGEDFATLAKEFSQLSGVEENAGEYLLVPGMMSPTLEELAFDPETALATLSEPIRDDAIITEGGYWLIKVVANDEDRPLDEADRDFLKTKALNEWVSSLWDDPENKVDDSYLDDEKKGWALQQAMRI